MTLEMGRLSEASVTLITLKVSLHEMHCSDVPFQITIRYRTNRDIAHDFLGGSVHLKRTFGSILESMNAVEEKGGQSGRRETGRSLRDRVHSSIMAIEF